MDAIASLFLAMQAGVKLCDRVVARFYLAHWHQVKRMEEIKSLREEFQQAMEKGASSPATPRSRACSSAIGEQARAGGQTVMATGPENRPARGGKRASASVTASCKAAREAGEPDDGFPSTIVSSVTERLPHAPIVTSQQQLAGVGPFLAWIEARAVLSGVLNLLQDERQRNSLDQGVGQHDGMAAHGFGRASATSGAARASN
jgi:hypothetical protein